MRPAISPRPQTNPAVRIASRPRADPHPRAFADVVARGQDDFVVLDTAPTGHSLLLLDALFTESGQLLAHGRLSERGLRRALATPVEPGGVIGETSLRQPPVRPLVRSSARASDNTEDWSGDGSVCPNGVRCLTRSTARRAAPRR